MTRREWLATLGGLSSLLAADVVARAAQTAPPAAGDPTALGLADLQAAYASGRLTPLEVTAAYLARIDRENPALGAYVTVSRDRAMDESRRLRVGVRGTGLRSPLIGVPVAHKDLFKTRGVRTAGGSRLYEHDVPAEDAEVVTRMAMAGAVMLGKTNTHELGGGVTTINPFFGTTHNPRDITRIPGGSSGGSAAAVAARLALVATGSDTGGSVRIPAALCGCVGLKPTFGLLPTTGLLGACPTFDHAGLLTRATEDAALILATIVPSRDGTGLAGEAFVEAYRAAVTRGLRGLLVGVARSDFVDRLEPGVLRAVEGSLERLRVAGARVRDVSIPSGAPLYDEMFGPIAVSEIRATYARAFRARPDAFSKDFAAVFDGPAIGAAALATAREARDAVQRSIEALLEGVDVVVTPTVPMVAPPIAGPIDGMRILQNTWVFNAARVPAVSVPCGTGASGLPVGLQLIGRPFGEPALLAVATLVERLGAA